MSTATHQQATTSPTRVLAGPLLGLAALFVLVIPLCIFAAIKGIRFSDGTEWLYNAAYSFLVAWGVELDRKARGTPAPFEYSAFMFFLWWAMLPVYLFKTRRWRGLAAALAIVIASSVPSLVAVAVYILLPSAATQ